MTPLPDLKQTRIYVLCAFFALVTTTSIAAESEQKKAQMLFEEGARLHTQEKFREAEVFYKKSLEIFEAEFGIEHPKVAAMLTNLATVYMMQDKYSDAELLYKRALAIREKKLGPNSPQLYRTLDGLGNLAEKMEKYSEAEQFFKRALNIAQKAPTPDYELIGDAEVSLGFALLNQGRDTEAELLFKKSLQLNEKAFGLDSKNIVSALNSLAYLYNDQERYLEAEPLYKRALAILEKSGQSKSLEAAVLLENIGNNYLNMKHYEDAINPYRKALSIRESILGANHSLVADSLFDLGVLSGKQKHYNDAETFLRRSLKMRKENLGSEHPNVAAGMNSLANVLVELERFDDAEKLYKDALKSYDKYLSSESTRILNNLAEMYNKQGRFTDALPIVQKLIPTEEIRDSVALETLYGSQKFHLLDNEKALSDSYHVMQYSLASSAGDAVVKLAQRLAATDPELSKAIRHGQDLDFELSKLEGLLVQAASKSPNQRDPAWEEKYRIRVRDIEIERKYNQSILAQKFPDYAALSKPAALTISETQKLLDDDEAVVSLWMVDEKVYAWVITNQTAFWTQILAKDLDLEVAQIRDALKFSENGRAIDKPFDSQLAYNIYKQTLAPVADQIRSMKRISFVVNGALTSIPLGILITNDPAGKSLKDVDWLIKSTAVTVLPSIYSLKVTREYHQISHAQKPMIAFADPVFSRVSGIEPAAKKQVPMRSLTSFYDGTQFNINKLRNALSPLPSTRDEVEAIGKSLKVSAADLKFGLSATETEVKKAALDQYRIVYFATHGLVAGDVQKFSKAKTEPALVLSIPNKPTELDDGLLQASEIALLKLDADWAVLSACNTASADGVGAEALSGLARAFLYAGARSLVVSHWDVADEAAKSLMSSLFEISVKNPGLSHGEAMRKAILKLINDAQTDEELHPRYWAPFVVVGEPSKKGD